MKTSKIIFISLISAISVVITVAVIDLRFNGHLKATDQADYQVNKQAIPSFKVLYVNNCKDFHIVQKDSSFYEFAWFKDSLPPRVNYTVKDDTLILSDINLLIQNYTFLSFTIFSTDSLNCIISNNSNVYIDRFNSDKLTLVLDKSHVWFNLDKNQKSSFHSLDVLARNESKLNASEFKIDTIEIVLRKSEANLSVFAKKISGILSDNSKILMLQPVEISLKRDSTSNITVSVF